MKLSDTSTTTGTATRIVAFLFTDIEGSTRLWQDHPEAMKSALARHDELLRETIEERGGNVFKTVGDAFYAAFSSPLAAVAAAAAAQAALSAEPWPAQATLRVRMGLHLGEAELRDGDYFGASPNRVARLVAAGHGGQVLISDALQSVVADSLPAGMTLRHLGEHQLKDLSRPISVYQLVADGLGSDFSPLRTLSRQKHNLPSQLTSFIGRQHELEDLAERLREARLLTLTGIGGTGKTRLALQLAAGLVDQFADGVWLVELATVVEPESLPATVAAALSLAEEPGRRMDETLVDHLKTRQTLLVIDNCEHLLEPCVRLAGRLLAAAPGLRILATSREALGIAGETSWPVASLGLPPGFRAASEVELAEAARSEAVQLFVERARAAQPQFELNAERLPAVVQICRRLDGIPLALELAAARVRMLPPVQIASRLDDRFRLLTGGSRTALPRHQTLLAALDWSYDLLEEPEQTIFRRFAVFRGGWTLEAAEAVASGGSIEAFDVLDLLTRLVDKSLVTAEHAQDRTRYRYLETVRQYARDRLAASGIAETLREAHLSYFVTLAEGAERGLNDPEQDRIMVMLEQEHDNLRAAVDRAVAGQKGPVGLRLGAALWRFWYIRGYLSEGRAKLEAILDLPRPEGCEVLLASVLNGDGALAMAQGDYPAARARFEAGLAIRRELGDQSGIAGSLGNLGVVALDQGDLATARALQEEGLAIRRNLGETWSLAPTLGNLGAVLSEAGDYEGAKALYEESLAIYRERGDKMNIAVMLGNLGILAMDQGDYVAAQELHRESLMQSTELGDREGMSAALAGLGWAALGLGQNQEASRYHVESLMISRETGHKRRQTESLEVLGWLAAAMGDPDRAARLMAAAEAQWQALGVAQSERIRSKYSEEAKASAKAALGAEVFDGVWTEGSAMKRDAALTLALGVGKATVDG